MTKGDHMKKTLESIPRIIQTVRLSPLAALFFFCIFTVPCLAAERKTLDAPQVKQTTPQAPAAKPVRQPAAPLIVDIQGSLNAMGNKVNLRLNLSATEVEAFTGRKKMATLGAGASFDVTALLDHASAQGLTFHYYRADGSYNTQTFTPQQLQDFSGRKAPPKPGPTVGGSPTVISSIGQVPPSAASGPPVDGPPAPQPNYPPHHGGLEVTSPMLGDKLTAGQQYDIVWDVHGYLTTDCAQIFLYQGSNQVRVITQQWGGRDTPGQAGYHWTVPQNLAGTYTVKVRTCDGEAEDFSDNFLIVNQIPDLSVSGITITPGNPDTGDTIRIQGWVTNVGLSPIDSARVRLTVRDPNGIEHQFQSSFSNIHFGGQYQFTKYYKVNRKGTYVNIVHADIILSTAAETNMDNNEATINATIDGRPDLIACAWVNPVVNALHQDEVWGYIKNYGDKQSMPSTAKIWIEGKGSQTVSVPLLVPGDSHRVGRNVTWGAQGPDKDFYIEADSGNVIEERREDNNKVVGVIVIQGSLASVPDPNTYIVEDCSGNGIKIQNHPYSVTEQGQP